MLCVGAARSGFCGAALGPADATVLMQMAMQKTQYFLRITERSKGTEEENAVETFVMAKKAEEAGITVSDTAVKSFLNQIIGDSLTSQQVAEVIASLRRRDAAVSEAQLFNALRQELLANEYIRLFQLDLQPIPPGQRWDYFLRMNRRRHDQALALPVANFLGRDAGARAIRICRNCILAHRDQLPDPTSPEPGFKSPKKVAVQYFKADREAFIKRAEAASHRAADRRVLRKAQGPDVPQESAVAGTVRRTRAPGAATAMPPAESPATPTERPRHARRLRARPARQRRRRQRQHPPRRERLPASRAA